MNVWRILLRRGSVILLLAWLTVLAAVFVQRQLSTQQVSEPAVADVPTNATGERPVRVQRGVEYSSMADVEVSYRVAASEAVEYESGWAELRGIEVSFYSRGEVAYGLSADRGRFNVASKEARTEGETLLSLRGGVALRSDGFVLKGAEGRLESVGPVAMAGAGWGGVADHAKVTLGEDVLELQGGVSISVRPEGSPESLILLTPHVRYDRRRALLTFPSGLQLGRQAITARCADASLQLESAEGQPRRLELSGPVWLGGYLPDGSPVEGEAGDTTVDRLPDGKLQVAAAALPRPGWVWIHWLDATLGWQELTAWRLVGEGRTGAWEWLEGQGLACGTQLGVPHEGARRVEGDRLRLVLAEGRPTKAAASGHVRLDAGDRWATGGGLETALATRSFSLTSAADDRVRLGAPELDGWCDTILGADDGTITAKGKVGGVLRREPGTANDGIPVHFAADTAVLPPAATSISLAGETRFWQGERLVRADRLDYDTAANLVRGEGHVLTRAPLADSQGKGELVVTSRLLTYERLAGKAVYEGEVEVRDPRGTARCGRLVVHLDSDGRATSAELDGGVTLQESGTGRQLTGQRGHLDMAEDLLQMWGSPVLVREPDGNQIKGDRLEWRRRTATVAVIGGEDSPSETLYHPPEQGSARTPGRRRP
ncbi:MAG TPA: hypothetical protein PLS53_09370 [Thermoanaerobaculaceae bacterium]|nr:hypothetical protein [Thermoanaerobaculaceae bacterium]HPS78353.1 hypothetical protein [Thermoanaerobaculaceae bacterium]